MTTQINEEMVACTQCGGDGNTGQDEDGRYFTCYRCCETGSIPRAEAEQEAREAAQAARDRAAQIAAERSRLGVPDGYGYCFDDYDGTLVLIAPRRAQAPQVVEFEDIPF
jgi:hypothetical protein